MRHLFIDFLSGISFCLLTSCSLVFNTDDYLAGEEEHHKKSSQDDNGDAASSNDEKADAATLSESLGAGSDSKSKKDAGSTVCRVPEDCIELNLGFNKPACLEGECVECDSDNDNWLADEEICSELQTEFQGDCDDSDPSIYPNAPMQCRDEKKNNCLSEEPSSELRELLGIQELDRFPIFYFTNFKDIDQNTYKIDISKATQLSIAGTYNSSKEGLGVALSFIDEEIHEKSSDITRTAQLVSFSIGGNEKLIEQELHDYSLNSLVDTNNLESVRVRRLPDRNNLLLSFIGQDESGGKIIWYSPLEPDDNGILTPYSLDTYSIPQDLVCNNETLAPSIQPINSRLAIAPQLTKGSVRTIWSQNQTDQNNPIIVSHLYQIDEDVQNEAFECQVLEEPFLTNSGFLEISDSTGPFVLGRMKQNVFIWDGITERPIILDNIDFGASRLALTYLGENDYLIGSGGINKYQAIPLSCRFGNSMNCDIDEALTTLTEFESHFAAMDDLGNLGTVFALVDSYTPHGQVDQIVEEIIIRLLDSNGANSNSITLYYNDYLIPKKAENEIQIVDLALSAWFNSKEDFPLTILVAAMATRNNVAVNLPESSTSTSGELIVVGGLRGCTER